MHHIEKRKKMNNRGLTLIELVVTVAIISVFAGVVLLFMTTGAKTYSSTSSGAKVQMETQETFDRIEDLIIDTNRSVYYAYGTGSSIGAEIQNDIKAGSGDNSDQNKTFIVCNEYENNDGTSQYICDVLDWDKDEQKIYYSQREYTATSTPDDTEESDEETLSADEESAPVEAGEQNIKDVKVVEDRSVLASGILDFRADVSKAVSDKIVRFQLSTQNGKKEIETLHSVSLRNAVKVKKPSDAFDRSDSTDVGIKITYAPASMDPGASDMLVYGLTGNGSIDPTTVTWKVVGNPENGSFPSADHTNGRLTISDGASGFITVQVSAKTTKGDWITSAPVTIQINGAVPTETPVTPTPAPETLILEPGNLLLGAGNNYDMNSLITSAKLHYSDGTEKDVKDSLSWTADGSFVTLSSGKLSIDSGAGHSGSGSFTLTASDASGMSAAIAVTVARIDLQKPAGTYKPGDTKELVYTYMENGNIIDIGTAYTLTPLKKPDSAGNYVVGEKFSQVDAGDWTMQISYALENKGGYGTVSGSRDFKVSDGLTVAGDIILNKNDQGIEYDTVIADRTYNCSSTVGWGFNFGPTDGPDWENSEVRWSLKGEYKGIHLENVRPSDRWAEVVIDSDAKTGFILCAEYIQYTDWTKTTAKKRSYGEKEVKVATGITLSSLSGDTAYVGEPYNMQVTLTEYDASGTEGTVTVKAGGKTAIEWTNNNEKMKGSADGIWSFTPDQYDGDKTMNLEAKLQFMDASTGIFDTKSNIQFVDTITIDIRNR